MAPSLFVVLVGGSGLSVAARKGSLANLRQSARAAGFSTSILGKTLDVEKAQQRPSGDSFVNLVTMPML
jgi:hypothetical protein